MVDFTPRSELLEPAEVVRLLDRLFSHFDALAERYGVEKIKTIGDAYMVAAGVPQPRPDHARALVSMGLDMVEAMHSSDEVGHLGLELRVGINSGPVVAGVIGRKRFLYDLWGDAVNTASRMESHGTPGRVQITRATYELVADDFECEPRGTIAVKGKGEMEIWHVLRRRPDALPQKSPAPCARRTRSQAAEPAQGAPLTRESGPSLQDARGLRPAVGRQQRVDAVERRGSERHRQAQPDELPQHTTATQGEERSDEPGDEGRDAGDDQPPRDPVGLRGWCRDGAAQRAVWSGQVQGDSARSRRDGDGNRDRADDPDDSKQPGSDDESSQRGLVSALSIPVGGASGMGPACWSTPPFVPGRRSNASASLSLLPGDPVNDRRTCRAWRRGACRPL